MEIKSIKEELNSLAYHGRGIMIGKSADGKKAVIAYFIMAEARTAETACSLRTAMVFALRLSTSPRWLTPTLSSTLP